MIFRDPYAFLDYYPPPAPPELIERCLSDRDIRRALVQNSHYWFFHIYFPHFVKYPTAGFQRMIFWKTEWDDLPLYTLVGFRSSAKSTICSLSLPLWAILGKQKKKFIVVVTRTQEQLRLIMQNIKNEIDTNTLLRHDLGPFQVEGDEKRIWAFTFSNFGAKVMGVSVGQSIRGLRFGAYRPQLIICDDLEDQESVKTQESRDDLYSWLMGTLIPAGGKDTRLIVLGSYLHEDGLLPRLGKMIETKEISGDFDSFPLIQKRSGADYCLWPGRFPDEISIERERKRIGDPKAWEREMLNRIVSDAERVVHPEWIRTYEQLPEYQDRRKPRKLREILIGVDLAISKNDHADYTTMVAVKVYGWDDDMEAYVLPFPVNERLTSFETIEKAKELAYTLGTKTHFLIEDVGYQRSLIETFDRDGFWATGIPVHGQDKRGRLAMAAQLIQDGTIQFPMKGAELLVNQLIGFGTEKHDDLADGLSIIGNYLLANRQAKVRVRMLGGKKASNQY